MGNSKILEFIETKRVLLEIADKLNFADTAP